MEVYAAMELGWKRRRGPWLALPARLGRGLGWYEGWDGTEFVAVVGREDWSIGTAGRGGQLDRGGCGA